MSRSGNPQKVHCLRRLQKDYKELLERPIPGIAAAPLEENWQEWHINIAPVQGYFVGVVLHFKMSFPDRYPVQPPTIRPCTRVEHPNVFGDYICLDMLVESVDSSRPYEGWYINFGNNNRMCVCVCVFFFWQN